MKMITIITIIIFTIIMMVITVYVGLRWGREYMKMAQTSKSKSYTA